MDRVALIAPGTSLFFKAKAVVKQLRKMLQEMKSIDVLSG